MCSFLADAGVWNKVRAEIIGKSKRLHANLQDLRIGNAHVMCDEDSIAQCSVSALHKVVKGVSAADCRVRGVRGHGAASKNRR